jgi:hypothetical protein
MLAAEAVLHAALTEDELVEIQLRVPLNGYSGSSDAEVNADARQNAKDVLARKADGNPQLSGCPARRGGAGGAELRETFAHYCTGERAELCPIGATVWWRLTTYHPTLRSSIWRELGLGAREVYEIIVERAAGKPSDLKLTSRYIAKFWPYVPKSTADTALRRLVEHGLLRQEKKGSGIYTLPTSLSAEALAELEQRLGTAEAWAREVERIDAAWAGRKEEARDYAITKTLEAELATLDEPATDE